MAKVRRLDPVRTCCGCGRRELQVALTRMTRTAAGSLVLDAERRRGGRGAYLHARPACWETFMRGKGLLRSLRSVAAPPEREAVVAALRRRLGHGATAAPQTAAGGRANERT